MRTDENALGWKWDIFFRFAGLIVGSSVFLYFLYHVYRHFDDNRTKLSISLQDVNEEGLSVLANNDGERPGTITDAQLIEQRGDQLLYYALTLGGLRHALSIEIAQHHWRLVKLDTYKNGVLVQKTADSPQHCSLYVRITNFDGKEETQNQDIDCSRLRFFLATRDVPENRVYVNVSRKPAPGIFPH